MIPFRKMHGLGNDFVVLDDRGRHPGHRRRRAPPPWPTAAPASAATSSSCWSRPTEGADVVHAHPQPGRLRGRRLRQCHPLHRLADRRRGRARPRRGPHHRRRPAGRGAARRPLARRHGPRPARLAGRAAGRGDGHPPPAARPRRADGPGRLLHGQPARDLLRPGPRCGAARHARPLARDRPALPRARQYRRRPGPHARAYPPGGLGTRRRADAAPAAPAPAPPWSMPPAAASPAAAPPSACPAATSASNGARRMAMC